MKTRVTKLWALEMPFTVGVTANAQAVVISTFVPGIGKAGDLEQFSEATVQRRNIANGSIVWKTLMKDADMISQPVLDGDFVYVCVEKERRAWLSCLSLESGSVVWSFRAPEGTSCHAAMVQSAGGGSVVWSLLSTPYSVILKDGQQVAQVSDARTYLATIGETVLFRTATAIVALTNGGETLLWTKTIPATSHALVRKHSVWILDQGSLAELNLASGTTLRTLKVDYGAGLLGFELSKDIVSLLEKRSVSGWRVGPSQSAKQLWRKDLMPSAAYATQHGLLLVTTSNSLIALDQTTGKELFVLPIGSRKVVITEDMVILWTLEGEVSCFKL